MFTGMYMVVGNPTFKWFGWRVDPFVRPSLTLVTILINERIYHDLYNNEREKYHESLAASRIGAK